MESMGHVQLVSSSPGDAQHFLEITLKTLKLDCVMMSVDHFDMNIISVIAYLPYQHFVHCHTVTHLTRQTEDVQLFYTSLIST